MTVFREPYSYPIVVSSDDIPPTEVMNWAAFEMNLFLMAAKPPEAI